MTAPDRPSAHPSVIPPWATPAPSPVARERREAIRPMAAAAAWLRDTARHQPGLVLAIAGIVAFLGALALRTAALGTAYDILIDEVTYLFIARDVAMGAGVTLHGEPFLLHPPLFFLVQAPFVAGPPSTPLLIDQVTAARVLDATLGALTATVLLALTTRIAGWRVGLVAFALFAIDPFIVRMNSRNLLETLAILLVLTGYLILLWDRRADVAVNRIALAGVAFGGALLTKEMTAPLTLLPLALLAATGWAWPRRSAVAIGVVAVGTYLLYPIGVVISGLGPHYLEQKASGLLRFLGIVKETGFVPGGPSFIDAVARNLDVFASTYVLIALGIPASLLLVWRGDLGRRVVGVVGVSAYALLAYSISFGTLEEQFFYFLVVPAIISVPMAWSIAMAALRGPRDAIEWRPRAARARVPGRFLEPARRALAIMPAALVLSLSWSGLVWAQVHLTPDDGYRHVLRYLHDHVPQGTAIGVTTDPQEFLLQGYVIDRVRSVDELANGDARYVVTSTKQIEAGYTEDGQELYAWLRSHARPVYAFDGRTYGRLEVFRVHS